MRLCVSSAVLFFSMAFTDELDTIFADENLQFSDDASNTPVTFDPTTFGNIESEGQSLDNTILLLANNHVDSESSTDLAPSAGSNFGDDLTVPPQDIFADLINGDSPDVWDDIAPGGTLLDIADPSPDPHASSSLAETSYLSTTSPIDHLDGALNHLHFPLPDLTTIFKEKCPPIRVGDRLTPLCCTGDRVGPTVTECVPYDLKNWNCYLRPYQYCCKLFITESREGVSCRRGFA